MQVLSYETYYLVLIIFIFIFILFIMFSYHILFHFRASKLYLSMQNAIDGDKTDGQ